MAEKVFEAGDVRLLRGTAATNGGAFIIEAGEDGAKLTKRQLFDLGLAALDQLLEVEDGLPSCKGCNATIKWVTTENGKSTPLDPKPKTFVSHDGKYQVGFTPHWASCPAADEFRKKRA